MAMHFAVLHKDGPGGFHFLCRPSRGAGGTTKKQDVTCSKCRAKLGLEPTPPERLKATGRAATRFMFERAK